MLGTVVLGICLLVSVPLVYLAVRVADAGDDAWAAFWRPRTAELAVDTALLTVVVTGICLVLGIGLAFAAVRLVGGRPLLVGLLAAPLAMPSYVSGFAWTRLFPGFDGFWAAVLVMSSVCYPLVLLPVASALAGSGRSMEDVARTLGCGPFRTFAAVTLRRIAPTAVVGGLLVALYTLGDFGGPASVRFESFTVGIYNAYNGAFDRTLPAVYSLALIAAALILSTTVRLCGTDTARPVAAVETAPARHGAVARSTALAVMAAVMVVALAVPLAALVREIRQSQRLAGRSVADLASWMWPDLQSTLGYALAGGLAVTVVAIPIALFTARPRRRGAGAVEAISYLGYTLPGVTVGLAFVFVGIRLGRDYYLTPGLLILCYAALFLPLAAGPIRAALDGTADSLTDAARTLGAGQWGVLFRVRLPLVLPGIAAGALLAGLTIAKELPATLLLRPIGTQTLATHMWSLSNDSATGEAALLGIVLVVVTALPTALISATLFARSERR